MTRWRDLPGERLETYSPVGLIPTDAFTTREPFGRIKVMLDIREANGVWRQTDVKEIRTASGVIAYPGLGRSATVFCQPARRYRLRVEAEFYLPLYTKTAEGTLEGIEFDGFPYNDTYPPKNYPAQAADFPDYLKSVLRKLWLVPAPNYPFPNHVRVLRGVVVESNTERSVAGAEVSWGNKEIALTDKRGAFGLPLRVKGIEHLTEEQKIDANDRQVPLRQGTIKIIIPKALGTNQRIPIS
ncbi:MAG TPA: hypothetical protein VK582_04370 [Pyrinomonadaceae bacterium]|nr:hypothetical protein [Pyrinomonadaceae bacterium]